MIVEIILFTVLAYLIWLWKTQLPRDYPPTPPIRLPILGHMPYYWFYCKDPVFFLDQIYEKYGKDGAVAFHMGQKKIIGLTDFKLAKEALKKEEFNYRQPSNMGRAFMKEIRGGKTGLEGIISNHSQHWQEQRRFTLTTLKDFGFGKAGMEEIILDEASYLCEHIDEQAKKSGSTLKLANFFNICVLNVLWRIVAGERYELEDPRLKALMTMICDFTASGSVRPGIMHMFPGLATSLPNSRLKENKSRISEVKAFLESAINRHRESFDENNIRDFIDAYLLEISKTEDVDSSFHPENGLHQLMGTLIDLFAAGSDTTSSSLTWAILFMVNNVDIQTKVREEILRVVGHNRAPTLKDRIDLPYTDATIMEIQRVGNIVPKVRHANLFQSAKIGKFNIPQGHLVFPSLTKIFHSDDYWKEAGSFNPERFLMDGKVCRNEKLIPFSVGKRQCPGESLARAEIFLFFTSLIQKFEFLPEDLKNPPKMEFNSGTTSVPKPFNVNVQNVIV